MNERLTGIVKCWTTTHKPSCQWPRAEHSVVLLQIFFYLPLLQTLPPKGEPGIPGRQGRPGPPGIPVRKCYSPVTPKQEWSI